MEETSEKKVRKNQKKGARNMAKTMEQVDIGKLKDMKMSELAKLAKEMNINGISGIKKQDLITKETLEALKKL